MTDPEEDDPPLTRDAFLNGRLMLWQPRSGYRAATDPVLLAAAVPAQAGAHVLDLGCGIGTAALCLECRVPGLVLHGVELQRLYADLAERNAAAAGSALTVHHGNVAQMPKALRSISFDHVMANPPYLDPARHVGAALPARDRAFRDVTVPLAGWIDAGLRRLRPGGCYTMIQRMDRLPELLAGFDGRAGDITLLPLAARAGRPAARVILRARKGARGALRMLAPFVLHDGDAHRQDGEDFSAAAQAVLRDAKSLP